MSSLIQPPSNSIIVADERSHRRAALGAAMLATLGGNVAILWTYFIGWINLGELLWTYWVQSVIIGIFNFVRMMKLKQFSTAGLTSGGRPVPETPEGKRSSAIFFLCHYGFFHAGYAGFLLMEHREGSHLWPWLALTALSFVVGEWFSFREHRAMDDRTRPNLGAMMFLPYLRIVPMHLTIILGGVSAAGVVFFPLKILADVLMLLVEHNIDRKRAAGEEPEAAKPAA